MIANPLPDRSTPHTVLVRPHLGSGPYGDIHGPPVSVEAFVVDERVMVRDSAGAEVVSSTQATVNFDTVAPPGSLVTVWPGVAGEREAEVISTTRAAHPTLPAYQTLALK